MISLTGLPVRNKGGESDNFCEYNTCSGAREPAETLSSSSPDDKRAGSSSDDGEVLDYLDKFSPTPVRSSTRMIVTNHILAAGLDCQLLGY